MSAGEVGSCVKNPCCWPDHWKIVHRLCCKGCHCLWRRNCTAKVASNCCLCIYQAGSAIEIRCIDDRTQNGACPNSIVLIVSTRNSVLALHVWSDISTSVMSRWRTLLLHQMDVAGHTEWKVNALGACCKHWPRLKREYPLNLSISVSGGKQTKQDSLSNCEWTEISPTSKPPCICMGGNVMFWCLNALSG